MIDSERSIGLPGEHERIGIEVRGEAGRLPPGWSAVLSEQLLEPYWSKLMEFVDAARSDRDRAVYPSADQTFAAFALSAYEHTRVVIVGQDPYHGPGQAHGLCYSVPDEVLSKPPSLVNICKELRSDLAVELSSGDLSGWAKQGVLLLNTTLTVRAGQAGSHRRHGWETFTDAVIGALNAKGDRVIFLLWGKDAQRKTRLITDPRHKVIESSHPSPRSAHRGFLGSKPFSTINRLLAEADLPPIDWSFTPSDAVEPTCDPSAS